MKTLESAYIFPIIFIFTGFIIITSMKMYDAIISKALQYGYLVHQASYLENDYYNPDTGLSKTDIENNIYNLYLIGDKPAFSACLSGDTLYLSDNSKSDSVPIFFSHFERCENLRKESAILQQFTNK